MGGAWQPANGRRQGGSAALTDLSSRRHCSPRNTSAELASRVETLRRERWTSVRIAQATGLSRRHRQPHLDSPQAAHSASPRTARSRYPLRTSCSWRSVAHRYQKARAHRQARPPHHRQSTRRNARCRLGTLYNGRQPEDGCKRDGKGHWLVSRRAMAVGNGVSVASQAEKEMQIPCLRQAGSSHCSSE